MELNVFTIGRKPTCKIKYLQHSFAFRSAAFCSGSSQQIPS